MVEMSVRRFVMKHCISAEAEEVGENPNMTDQKWKARHYEVTLKMGSRQMTTYYSMGKLVEREPGAVEVLDCLVLDAGSVVDSGNFEQWCRDMGYDSDSRRAEKTYKAIRQQTKHLINFLGRDKYEELLGTERL